jgi:hypothetical protein
MARKKFAKSKAETGTHGMHPRAGWSRKSSAQTAGQYSRDTKGRKGQYGGAGDSPLIKK